MSFFGRKVIILVQNVVVLSILANS